MQFDIAPFSFAYTIQDDGLLCNSTAANVDALCVIAPSLLPRLAFRDEQAHSGILSEGDAELLAEIFFLSRNLRWDAAEDLSVCTGDIAAERLMQILQNARLQLRDGAVNLSQAAAEYLTEEQPLLAKPQRVSAFMLQVDMTRDDVARLEQRINRLLTAKKS